MFLFEKVAVLGAGLLGASLGLAMKKRGLCARVSAWSRSQQSRDACAASTWCDFVSDNIGDVVDNADLVVLASTPDSIPQVAEKAVVFAKNGAVFTDLGSTKSGIVRRCAPLFEGMDFFYVPSHPMAGSEKSGARNADADIFENAACFVCPTSNAAADSKIKEMWERLGMRVFEKSPSEHDVIVAAVSHIPQCVASGLSVFASKDPEMYGKFAGNGFRDTTRIAKSDTAMWLSIFKENSENIEVGLREYIRIMTNLADQIKLGDDASLEAFLKNARLTRESMDK